MCSLIIQNKGIHFFSFSFPIFFFFSVDETDLDVWKSLFIAPVL